MITEQEKRARESPSGFSVDLISEPCEDGVRISYNNITICIIRKYDFDEKPVMNTFISDYEKISILDAKTKNNIKISVHKCKDGLMKWLYITKS